MQGRRSIRRCKNEAVSPEDLAFLMKTVGSAPTGVNNRQVLFTRCRLSPFGPAGRHRSQQGPAACLKDVLLANGYRVVSARGSGNGTAVFPSCATDLRPLHWRSSLKMRYSHCMKTIAQIVPNNFMDLLLDAVCVVDREGYFLFVSAASERIFGYTPEEMIGRAVIDFVHPGDRERTLQTVNEILNGELKPYFENRYVKKDGKIAHIMWSARWSESEQIRVAVARDITERKRAESMQAAVYAISEAANTPGDLQALFQSIHEVVDDLAFGHEFRRCAL